MSVFGSLPYPGTCSHFHAPVAIYSASELVTHFRADHRSQGHTAADVATAFTPGLPTSMTQPIMLPTVTGLATLGVLTSSITNIQPHDLAQGSNLTATQAKQCLEESFKHLNINPSLANFLYCLCASILTNGGTNKTEYTGLLTLVDESTGVSKSMPWADFYAACEPWFGTNNLRQSPRQWARALEDPMWTIYRSDTEAGRALRAISPKSQSLLMSSTATMYEPHVFVPVLWAKHLSPQELAVRAQHTCFVNVDAEAAGDTIESLHLDQSGVKGERAVKHEAQRQRLRAIASSSVHP